MPLITGIVLGFCEHGKNLRVELNVRNLRVNRATNNFVRSTLRHCIVTHIQMLLICYKDDEVPMDCVALVHNCPQGMMCVVSGSEIE